MTVGYSLLTLVFQCPLWKDPNLHCVVEGGKTSLHLWKTVLFITSYDLEQFSNKTFETYKLKQNKHIFK